MKNKDFTYILCKDDCHALHDHADQKTLLKGRNHVKTQTYTYIQTHTQASLGDIVGSVPNHHNKAHGAIRRVVLFFD